MLLIFKFLLLEVFEAHYWLYFWCILLLTRKVLFLLRRNYVIQIVQFDSTTLILFLLLLTLTYLTQLSLFLLWSQAKRVGECLEVRNITLIKSIHLHFDGLILRFLLSSLRIRLIQQVSLLVHLHTIRRRIVHRILFLGTDVLLAHIHDILVDLAQVLFEYLMESSAVDGDARQRTIQFVVLVANHVNAQVANHFLRLEVITQLKQMYSVPLLRVNRRQVDPRILVLGRVVISAVEIDLFEIRRKVLLVSEDN